MQMAGRLTILAALAAVVMASGCGENLCGEDLPCSVCEAITEPAALEIGDGEGSANGGRFVEVRDGDEMEVLLSPDGLYFFAVSIRARGVYPGEPDRWGHPSDPEIRIDLTYGQTLVGGSYERRALTVTEDGAERLGIFVPIFPDPYPPEFFDQLVTFRGEIADACGNNATGELEVLASSRW